MLRMDAKKTSLIQNLALFGGSTTVAQFIMMVYVLILARILGPKELGFFNSAYSLVGISAFFLNLGMDTWLLRKAGLFSDVTILSGKVLRIKAAIGVFWSLALIILAPLIRPDLYTLPMMVICSLDTWSDVCFGTEIQALNVQHRMKTITGLVLFSRGGRLLGLLLLYFFGVNSAVIFALVRAVATFAGFVAATYFHRPKWRTGTLISTRTVLTESLPFGLSEFLSLIYTNIDVTILAWMAGTTAVGLYSPASGIIHALFVIPNAMFTVMVPMMTRLVAESYQPVSAILEEFVPWLFCIRPGNVGSCGIFREMGHPVFVGCRLSIFRANHHHPQSDNVSQGYQLCMCGCTGFGRLAA